ncbi:MAG: plasmid replication protein RepC [Pseudomonadota bacterium]
MERLTTTPFGCRPVSAGLLAAQALSKAPAPDPRVSKWDIFRELCVARAVFGIRDRDLALLNALLTFHPGDDLADRENLIVFPSNRSLSERAHGMAESTLRRHLAALVQAGLILRHDSPNGKRYARRDANGDLSRAFGFDLRPLLVRAEEIAQAAQASREAEDALKTLREACVLLARDCVKLLCFGREAGFQAPWDAIDDELRLAQRALRRRPDRDLLEALKMQLSDLLKTLESICSAEEMSGKDVKNERHHQSSKPETSESEKSTENLEPNDPPPETVPLFLVLKACPDITDYGGGEIQRWSDLLETAGSVSGMMGISRSAWAQATEVMGPYSAAIALACMLQRVDQIRSPGGYLRHLTDQAVLGAFSPARMVMALLNSSDRQAA